MCGRLKLTMLPLSFLRRDFLIAVSYKTSFLIQLGSIFFAVPLFYFSTKIVDGKAFGPALDAYGGNIFAFLLIGVALVDFSTTSLRTFSESLRESQLMGTLEIVLLSPVRLSEILIYSSLWSYVLTSVRFVLYLSFGTVFGFSLGHANILAGLLILCLAILSFAAIGMLVSTATMVIKRGEGINTLVSAASVFLGGVIYPVSVLPPWMVFFSKLLPITYALTAMRLALIEGRSTLDLLPEVGILVAFAAVLLPLAFASFWAAVRFTKATGTLGQY